MLLEDIEEEDYGEGEEDYSSLDEETNLEREGSIFPK